MSHPKERFYEVDGDHNTNIDDDDEEDEMNAQVVVNVESTTAITYYK